MWKYREKVHIYQINVFWQILQKMLKFTHLKGVGDSMICKTDISNLKTDILEKVGQKIIVKGSLGRSKTFEKEATLEKAYPNIFVVRYEENNRNVTYSYTDVLTRTVEVDVFDGEAYSPLIPPQVEMKRKKAEVLV